jgi:hypothetical protein
VQGAASADDAIWLDSDDDDDDKSSSDEDTSSSDEDDGDGDGDGAHGTEYTTDTEDTSAVVGHKRRHGHHAHWTSEFTHHTPTRSPRPVRAHSTIVGLTIRRSKLVRR